MKELTRQQRRRICQLQARAVVSELTKMKAPGRYSNATVYENDHEQRRLAANELAKRLFHEVPADEMEHHARVERIKSEGTLILPYER